MSKTDKNHWIYEHNNDNSARFVLGTVGKHPLVCFGINPSTAAPNNLDQTLIRVSRYAGRNGFDSWIMLNIYPQRATHPDDLHPEVDNALHQKNLSHINRFLNQPGMKLWAAWGENITRRDYLFSCLNDINRIVIKNKCRWVCLGTTTNMHPYHPLYRGRGFRLYTSPLLDFDINKYIVL